MNKVKLIYPDAEITEEKYVKEIINSISKRPSTNSMSRNRQCVNLLRKARRG